jgi:phosphoheptose isomerase
MTDLQWTDELTLRHVGSLAGALTDFAAQGGRLRTWGGAIATILTGGGRLLSAGNGGSAAEAQHLVAELVGRMRADRRPYSAIALTAETAGLTAIANDYGYNQVFARQVRAHGRRGDALVLLSTSGRSPNLLAAAEAARGVGIRTMAVTGAELSPLALACDDALRMPSADPQTVQELHLVCVHLLCAHIEAALPSTAASMTDLEGEPVMTAEPPASAKAAP